MSVTLKRIGRQQLRLGMFIERFEGSWLDHPFWSKRFVLTDPAELVRLQNSAVEAIIIDEGKGVACPAVPAPSAKRPALRPRRPARSRIAISSADRERARAERVVQQSRRAIGQMFSEARLGKALQLRRTGPIIDEIAGALDHNPAALIELIRLKSIDSYTYLHSVAVSGLMIHLARHLGMEEDGVQVLGMAGLLHDIGKMAIPVSVLTKPARLTEDEVVLIRTHPEKGHSILSIQPDMPDTVLDVCLHHHQRIDGGGYPRRPDGTELSMAVRIAGICDVYDAVTSIRPYKKAWSPIEALSQMARWKGHFDEALLRAFAVSLGYEDHLDAIFAAQGEDTATMLSENGFSDPSA